jgi:hypothetical protein
MKRILIRLLGGYTKDELSYFYQCGRTSATKEMCALIVNGKKVEEKGNFEKQFKATYEK